LIGPKRKKKKEKKKKKVFRLWAHQNSKTDSRFLEIFVTLFLFSFFFLSFFLSFFLLLSCLPLSYLLLSFSPSLLFSFFLFKSSPSCLRSGFPKSTPRNNGSKRRAPNNQSKGFLFCLPSSFFPSLFSLFSSLPLLFDQTSLQELELIEQNT